MALGKDKVVLLMVVVPDEAPIFKVVAAPKALMVVAVVLKTENVEELVKTEVVKVGEIEKTKLPVPVSSVTEAATLEDEIEVVKLDEPSVVTNRLAVKPEKVIVPEEEIPVAPVIAPVPVISIEGVSRKLVNPPPPVLSMIMAEITALLSALFR